MPVPILVRTSLKGGQKQGVIKRVSILVRNLPEGWAEAGCEPSAGGQGSRQPKRRVPRSHGLGSTVPGTVQCLAELGVPPIFRANAPTKGGATAASVYFPVGRKRHSGTFFSKENRAVFWQLCESPVVDARNWRDAQL